MITVYGSTDNKNTHTDASNALLGAKQYATRHGLRNVSIRIGYNITLLEYKQDNKRHTYKGFTYELFA